MLRFPWISCRSYVTEVWLNAGRVYKIEHLKKKLCNIYPCFFHPLLAEIIIQNVYFLWENVSLLSAIPSHPLTESSVSTQNRRLSYWANKSEKFWLLTYWWDKSRGWGIIVQLAENMFSDPATGLSCCTAGAMSCCQGLLRISKLPLIKG